MTTDQIEFRPPSPAEFRATRYWIHRNVHLKSSAEAGDIADRELETWLAEQALKAAA